MQDSSERVRSDETPSVAPAEPGFAKPGRRHLARAIGLLAVGTFITPLGSLAEALTPLEARIDGVFSALLSSESPGCSVGVFQGEEILFAKGYGRASLDSAELITVDTVFDSASLAKQFTAAAVAKLLHDGEVDLGKALRERFHLPSLQQEMALQDLLHHTSGLKDFLALAAGNRVERADLSAELALELVLNNPQAHTTPGHGFRYSNSGYLLLAELVERVSEKSFEEHMQSEVFAPFGMTSTRVSEQLGGMVPEVALGHHWVESSETYRAYRPPPTIYGSGGVLTTGRDLYRWHVGLYGEFRGTGDRLIDVLSVPGRLRSGESVPYGMGMRLGTYRGSPTVHHGGGNQGFRHHLLTLPQYELTVVALCNASNYEPWIQTHEIAGLVLDHGIGRESDDP